MPGFDRTGPQGLGPMSGGARGVCNPAGSGNRMRFGGMRGRGFSRGNFGFGPFGGQGRGRGQGWYPPAYAAAPPMNSAEELQWLKNESLAMKDALDAVNSRIAELEKEMPVS